MAQTIYQANRILDRNFGNTTFTVPATLYIGLSTTTPSADGNPTSITEPSGGNYARVAVTNNKTNFTVASNAILSNAVQLSFPESSSAWSSSASPITHVLIFDAAAAGNLLYFDTLNPTRIVQSATTVLIAAGQMQISMTNT
jgi:hypothetical protein